MTSSSAIANVANAQHQLNVAKAGKTVINLGYSTSGTISQSSPINNYKNNIRYMDGIGKVLAIKYLNKIGDLSDLDLNNYDQFFIMRDERPYSASEPINIFIWASDTGFSQIVTKILNENGEIIEENNYMSAKKTASGADFNLRPNKYKPGRYAVVVKGIGPDNIVRFIPKGVYLPPEPASEKLIGKVEFEIK